MLQRLGGGGLNVEEDVDKWGVGTDKTENDPLDPKLGLGMMPSLRASWVPCMHDIQRASGNTSSVPGITFIYHLQACLSSLFTT